MQEKNYLSVIIFVLIVFALLIWGNYLIRNKGSISTTKINDIRLDKIMIMFIFLIVIRYQKN